MQSLKTAIERLASLGEIEGNPEARKTFLQFRDALTRGEIRAAEKRHGSWVVNTWVKRGILLGFRLGELSDMGDAGLAFVDKDTFPARRFTVADRVRVVPGGSSVRQGAYVAPSVICMPPMFINVGAYVDEGTMVDSHALVGSCGQVGKRVHLSAAAQAACSWRSQGSGAFQKAKMASPTNLSTVPPSFMINETSSSKYSDMLFMRASGSALAWATIKSLPPVSPTSRG